MSLGQNKSAYMIPPPPALNHSRGPPKPARARADTHTARTVVHAHTPTTQCYAPRSRSTPPPPVPSPLPGNNNQVRSGSVTTGRVRINGDDIPVSHLKKVMGFVPQVGVMRGRQEVVWRFVLGSCACLLP